MTDLGAVWSDLDSESAPPGVLRRRVDPNSSIDLFLTQRRPSRLRGFSAHVAGPPGSSWRTLRSSAGLDVQVSVQQDSAAIEVIERDERYRAIFSALVDDLLATVASYDKLPPDSRPLALDLLSARINAWQAALRAAPDGLSEEKQAGLYGELRVLSDLVEEVGVSVASAWTGADRTVQDFQLGGSSIEVKASRQMKPTVVAISSERQLDTSSVDRLFLVHLALEPRLDGPGDSLNQVVSSARTRLAHDDAALVAFEDSLLSYGYLQVHAPRYDQPHYSLRSVDIFEVRDQFPRLAEADLPTGVGDVTYHLALSACEQFRVPATTMWDHFRAVAP